MQMDRRRAAQAWQCKRTFSAFGGTVFLLKEANPVRKGQHRFAANL
jgi:hypothetical protein